jgi:rubrerythrin
MVAPINREYPLRQVRTLTELVEIAVGMEHEAASRYQELTNYMKQRGETQLAATFGQLAELERRHGDELRDWATRKGLPAPQPKQFSWRLPETFSLKDVGGAALSPYLILGIAVRNEELAFAFYTYVAAMAEDGTDVRECAESFAREELKHVAQLRKLRRQAFHAQSRTAIKRPQVAATLAELRHLAWGMEMGTAELTAMAAQCIGEDGHTETAALLTQTSEMALTTAKGLNDKPQREALPKVGDLSLDDFAARAMTTEALLRYCERDTRDALEAYLATADKAKDEPVLQQAQALAESAMARLALIRSLLMREGNDTDSIDWE